MLKNIARRAGTKKEGFMAGALTESQKSLKNLLLVTFGNKICVAAANGRFAAISHFSHEFCVGRFPLLNGISHLADDPLRGQEI